MKYSKRKRYRRIKGSKFTLLLLSTMVLFCGNISQKTLPLITGAEQTEVYLSLLENKQIGVVANNSSLLRVSERYVHLVDTLLSLGIHIKKIFAPEHGFRGESDAGEKLTNAIDPKTELPIISLYGKNRKPTAGQLEGLDAIVFDIQDVGARFYTYLSTMHYAMEASAEKGIPFIVLDRPNPNGHYIDGPVLDLDYKSFVGMHPVPVVYGMTIGEYAKMINGQGWLKNKLQCDLTVIPLKNYDRDRPFKLFVPPSPNLPNQRAVNLYPSLCFFEGTNINAGRGTEKQFQVYGSPYLRNQPYKYTPQSKPGASNPKYLGKECYGKDLSKASYLSKIQPKWLINAYQNTNDKKDFFNAFFSKLAGNETLKNKIQQGLSEETIRKSWWPDLKKFKRIRKKYLIYP